MVTDKKNHVYSCLIANNDFLGLSDITDDTDKMLRISCPIGWSTWPITKRVLSIGISVLQS